LRNLAGFSEFANSP